MEETVANFLKSFSKTMQILILLRNEATGIKNKIRFTSKKLSVCYTEEHLP